MALSQQLSMSPPQLSQQEILDLAASGDQSALSFANQWSPVLSRDDREAFFARVSALLAEASNEQ